MEATRANTQSALNQYSGSIFIAISIISILLVMILPMPSWFLDFLLTFNITFAILILMLAVYVASPLELAVFPSLLLVTTLYRLALNLASTKLILLNAVDAEGNPYLGAAGDVIRVFGDLVAGQNPVVGFIVFVTLEVSIRFTKHKLFRETLFVFFRDILKFQLVLQRFLNQSVIFDKGIRGLGDRLIPTIESTRFDRWRAKVMDFLVNSFGASVFELVNQTVMLVSPKFKGSQDLVFVFLCQRFIHLVVVR